jgi:hypothetical protein
MLQVERVDMAPAVLEPDARANVDERQVIVEGVLADRCENPPGGDGAGDEQEPGEGGEPEIAENPVVEPSADDEPLTPLGEGHRFVGLRSDVLGLRADETVVGDLLEDVRGPSCSARGCEGWREVLLGQADRLQDAR